jgi:hypothetical protein
MPNLHRHALLPILIVAVAACTGSGAGASNAPSDAPGSTAPSGAPSESPVSFGEIEHATGPTDVVLRYENGGGFVPPEFIATQAPIFTLYGDGTVVFRNPAAELPAPEGNVFKQLPFRTARLTEEQIQDLLTYALGEGNLGIARANYENNMISDASTATFTIDAGGIKKAVNIYALGMELDGMPDMPVRTQFQKLAERLGDFDQGGTIATDVYTPAGYRGVLFDAQGMEGAIEWPWPELTPADFSFPADANALQRGDRVMTQAEVDALGLTDVQGGFQGMAVTSPDGSRTYSFALRPLLPDETA